MTGKARFARNIAEKQVRMGVMLPPEQQVSFSQLLQHNAPGKLKYTYGPVGGQECLLAFAVLAAMSGTWLCGEW